jgi:hypothetical protein
LIELFWLIYIKVHVGVLRGFNWLVIELNNSQVDWRKRGFQTIFRRLGIFEAEFLLLKVADVFFRFKTYLFACHFYRTYCYIIIYLNIINYINVVTLKLINVIILLLRSALGLNNSRVDELQCFKTLNLEILWVHRSVQLDLRMYGVRNTGIVIAANFGIFLRIDFKDACWIGSISIFKIK